MFSQKSLLREQGFEGDCPLKVSLVVSQGFLGTYQEWELYSLLTSTLPSYL